MEWKKYFFPVYTNNIWNSFLQIFNPFKLLTNLFDITTPKNLLEIKDKKVLIWDEQGLGDNLQFSRFVIDLSKYTKK